MTMISMRNIVRLLSDSELVQDFKAELERADALNGSPSWSLQGQRETCKHNLEIYKAEIARRTGDVGREPGAM